MFIRKLISYLPSGLIVLLKVVRQRLRRIWYVGQQRYCPICELSSRKFLACGVADAYRLDAVCPNCRSKERHRLLWLYVETQTDLFKKTQSSVLHVAPEASLESKLRAKILGKYLTADLLNPNADVVMDIEKIDYPDESFDVIYCSHVLEHVDDDRQAMKEFYRVLTQSGWAILLVPITADKTFEDPTIIDPNLRLKLFGQEDHVRRYGPDYLQRLQGAGFTVKKIEKNDIVDVESVEKMALGDDAGSIFYCTKGDKN